MRMAIQMVTTRAAIAMPTERARIAEAPVSPVEREADGTPPDGVHDTSTTVTATTSDAVVFVSSSRSSMAGVIAAVSAVLPDGEIDAAANAAARASARTDILAIISAVDDRSSDASMRKIHVAAMPCAPAISRRPPSFGGPDGPNVSGTKVAPLSPGFASESFETNVPTSEVPAHSLAPRRTAVNQAVLALRMGPASTRDILELKRTVRETDAGDGVATALLDDKNAAEPPGDVDCVGSAGLAAKLSITDALAKLAVKVRVARARAAVTLALAPGLNVDVPLSVDAAVVVPLSDGVALGVPLELRL